MESSACECGCPVGRARRVTDEAPLRVGHVMGGSVNVKVRAHVHGSLAVGEALLVLTYVFSLNRLSRSISSFHK